ncbi:diguanylate cyclase [Deferribacteraceae bacterium V6Fe1]|nr:diguanylate cyclase [Deferribacteraceae bacterium V6Fe1]
MKKVLIIEDSTFFQEILKKELEDLNLKTFVASNIQEAKKLLENRHFDFITMDVNLPDGNGLDFCRELKQNNQFYKSQIIIISSEDDALLKKASFHAGAFSYFHKDYVEGNLRKFLKTTISMAQIITSSANPVVVIEDSEFQSKYIKSLFDLANISVISFEDVKSSLDFFSNDNNIDLIIVDYYLKDKTCESLIEKIRNNKFYDKVPIIVTTVLEEKEKKYDLFLLGVNDFVEKPFDPSEFFLRIRSHLRIKSLMDMLDAKNKLLSIKAITDELTGLFNRRFFWETIIREAERAKREKKTYSILIFDIDNFKLVNDTYGHLNGDKVLVSLADELKKCIRKFDTLARFGGEEFVMLLPNTDKNKASVVAEKILNITRNIKYEFTDKQITVSIGIADSSECSSFEEIIHLADDRLYKAKKNGKNRFELK